MSKKPLVKIKILDEVNCVIIGLSANHINYFAELYSRFAPNYFFNPKFKLGSWDGKIQYFHRTGKTHTYLLEEIIPTIVGLKYEIDLVDERSTVIQYPINVTKDYFSHITDPETGEPVQLRPYQVDAVNGLIDNQYGILVAGTGAGKSICNAALVDVFGKLGQKTITIVPNQDLIQQTKETFEFCELDTGEYSGDVKDIDHPHVVSTWQALQNNPSIMKAFDVVVVDECHGAKGQVIQKLLNEHGKHIAHRFGLTGTIPKAETDAMAVRIALGPVRYTITAAELIKQGWLATLHIDIMQIEEHMEKQYENFIKDNPLSKTTYTQFKDGYFPEYSAEKRYLQSAEHRLNWIKGHIQQKQDQKKGNVFCLVDGVRFGQKLAKIIDGAVFVHGKDKKKARREVYDLFKDNDNLVVIATVHIAGTGLNIKRIFNLMFIDVGKSFIRVIQTIGRGLRKAPDKDHVDVTDICSDLKYAKKHLRERTKFYTEAQYPYKKKKINTSSS